MVAVLAVAETSLHLQPSVCHRYAAASVLTVASAERLLCLGENQASGNINGDISDVRLKRRLIMELHRVSL